MSALLVVYTVRWCRRQCFNSVIWTAG